MKTTCSGCGSRVSAAHKFCSRCGAVVAAPKAAAGKTSPMTISTQPIPLTPWAASPFAPSQATRLRPAAPALPSHSTTGVPGREMEVMIIDRSGSTGEKGQRGTRMDDIKAANRAHLLQKRHIDKVDLVALVSFEDAATVECGWTRLVDPSPLIAAANGLRPGGSTCVNAGLGKAEELFSHRLASTGSRIVKKALLLTDGHNNVGDPIPLADKLKSEGVIIQTVGFAAAESDVDEVLLRRIASVIDGQRQYWFCGNAQELTSTFKTLSSKTQILPR
jgi:Mg-chelatase subunit ChlD